MSRAPKVDFHEFFDLYPQWAKTIEESCENVHPFRTIMPSNPQFYQFYTRLKCQCGIYGYNLSKKFVEDYEKNQQKTEEENTKIFNESARLVCEKYNLSRAPIDNNHWFNILKDRKQM